MTCIVIYNFDNETALFLSKNYNDSISQNLISQKIVISISEKDS